MLAMMFFLPIDVLKQRLSVRRANRERAIPTLPLEPAHMSLHPFRRGGLQLTDKARNILCSAQTNRHMNVIGNTANTETVTSRIANSKIGVQLRPDLLAHHRPPVLRAEDHMHQQEGQRLRHAEQYRSRFQRSASRRRSSWGFAPGSYGIALSALVFSLLSGCQSAPHAAETKSTTRPTAALYPPHPNTPAPPVKLFHKTADSLTLVTDVNASDDQIESLVWQLRDAAHTHTLTKLGPTFKDTQSFVDNNKTTWFHIYRGAKCATEKYASGNPPCGGSYHAAADYTFGTPGNPNWDQGTLLHDEKETLLWDSDALYSPSKP